MTTEADVAVAPGAAAAVGDVPAVQPLPRRQDGVSVRQLNGDLLLVEVRGQRFLTQAECPHRKGRLLFGYVNDRKLRITCPLHHSTFELTTGDQVSGPVCGSLKVTPLTGDGLPYPLR
ncbi:Rieske (2Fe-2S) protein [Saccharothrix sp.]|uniref:Rieske (2Fe-2S) protein n=1 Tax=Saccharothrix sp. TaxID=1873460 RepID=UPI0028125C8F|nr:Rieske (2Fe-2S) protein [Saccharothrix sp.]